MQDLSIVEVGSIVKVEGSVYYGDVEYDVNCIGIVDVIYNNRMLITLDIVDGDRKVGCLVKNEYIIPLSILESFKLITSEEFDTVEEYLDFLSEKFKEELKDSIDGQDAYDELDSKYSHYLSALGCVYSLFDNEPWSIVLSDETEPEDVMEYVSYFEHEYGQKFEDIDELLESLERHVMKTMSNVGCDVHNALELEINEINDSLLDCFSVYSEGDGPRIDII